MQHSPFTYQRVIILKLQAGFSKEEFGRGDSIEDVVQLALCFRFLLTQLEGSDFDQVLLKEASWQVDLLQHEAYAITSSPKKDMFMYLKAFHNTHEVFLRLHSQWNIMHGSYLI
ncbi:hypothetical protein [Rufibacter hautae]|uniref:Uncharacterized protein n=1 Tax=Rufibacter hautae TaxID=2595005 RepID=A0A5B6TF12_9BACT|nr:hypothetical protein [Rufibacter hautae]KAA3437954.1 hypothetical protein FOA19_11780 [Rufibacter hautae]